MRRLVDYRFQWVLPGHGMPLHLSEDRMRAALRDCIAWMDGKRRVA